MLFVAHTTLLFQDDLLRVKKPNYGWWRGDNVDNFLVTIEYDPVYNSYLACYANGAVVQLGSSTYQDAVLEADQLEAAEYE